MPCRGLIANIRSGGPWPIQLWHHRFIEMSLGVWSIKIACFNNLSLLIRITVCDHHVSIIYYVTNLLYPQCLSRLNLCILCNEKSPIFYGSCKNPLCFQKLWTDRCFWCLKNLSPFKKTLLILSSWFHGAIEWLRLEKTSKIIPKRPARMPEGLCGSPRCSWTHLSSKRNSIGSGSRIRLPEGLQGSCPSSQESDQES